MPVVHIRIVSIVSCIVPAVSPHEEDYILNMALSPSEEIIVCATASQQLLLHVLSSTDLTKVHINM